MAIKQNATGIKRLFNALRNSLNGLHSAWKSEQAVRQEIYLLIIGIPTALYLTQDNVERVLLILSLVLVLLVELINSAIEYTVDRIGTEHHELSGIAKDIASTAVLLSIVLAVVVWILILF